jgi:hypothetical protein
LNSGCDSGFLAGMVCPSIETNAPTAIIATKKKTEPARPSGAPVARRAGVG